MTLVGKNYFQKLLTGALICIASSVSIANNELVQTPRIIFLEPQGTYLPQNKPQGSFSITAFYNGDNTIYYGRLSLTKYSCTNTPRRLFSLYLEGPETGRVRVFDFNPECPSFTYQNDIVLNNLQIGDPTVWFRQPLLVEVVEEEDDGINMPVSLNKLVGSDE